MSILPGRSDAHSTPIVHAATFRRIDDPLADHDDCRKAVRQLGERIVAGEHAPPLLAMCDRWLDLYSVLGRPDAAL